MRNKIVLVSSLLMTVLMISLVPLPADALQASFTANPVQGTAPLAVHFTPTVSGGVQPYHYSWNFGDGQSSAEAAPSHIYPHAGSYTVVLSVTCSCTPPVTVQYQQMIVVTQPVPPLSVSISSSKEDGTVPLNISFSSVVNGGVAPYSYIWDFGDGSSSVEANPWHVFVSPGDFLVVLNVSSSDQSATSAQDSISVSAREPLHASISADIGIGLVPLEVNFTSSVSGGLPAYSYIWHFGDGNTSSSSNSSHEYSSPGNYTAYLEIHDSASDSITSNEVIVQVEAPEKSSTSGISLGGDGLLIGLGLCAFGGAIAARWFLRRGRIR